MPEVVGPRLEEVREGRRGARRAPSPRRLGLADRGGVARGEARLRRRVRRRAGRQGGAAPAEVGPAARLAAPFHALPQDAARPPLARAAPDFIAPPGRARRAAGARPRRPRARLVGRHVLARLRAARRRPAAALRRRPRLPETRRRERLPRPRRPGRPRAGLRRRRVFLWRPRHSEARPRVRDATRRRLGPAPDLERKDLGVFPASFFDLFSVVVAEPAGRFLPTAESWPPRHRRDTRLAS